MEEVQLTEEEIQAIQEDQEDDSADAQQDSLADQDAYRDAYGSPQPDPIMNQHSFLHQAAFGETNSLKTTYLNEFELGRPSFSVRFLLDMQRIAEHYLDELAAKYETDNKISIYFFNKVANITESGMSNEGFSMNLNVTRKMDMTRKRIKNPIENLKGGKKKK